VSVKKQGMVWFRILLDWVGNVVFGLCNLIVEEHFGIYELRVIDF
jgi:hypothetical protein